MTAELRQPETQIEVPLRPPELVMRLSRMGCFFPTRLSFMRSLVRWLHSESARVTKTHWDLDANGFGSAVYTVCLGGRNYSLCAFSNRMDPSERTDRVIANSWDATFALYDGLPKDADLERIRSQANLQEAGRYTPTELIVSRANKSTRLFEHVVEKLASGQQPEASLIRSIGYLMRTTAVYGNGKFGIADMHRVFTRPGFGGPFQAEFLTVWLIRGFTFDLVEHIAASRNPEGHAKLLGNFKRYLGIGNATGLGMAPFLVSHPLLLNNWMLARETALARVRSVKTASAEQVSDFLNLVERVEKHLLEWEVGDERQMERIRTTRREFDEALCYLTPEWLSRTCPWNGVFALARNRSCEFQELVIAMMLEPNGRLTDVLVDDMSSEKSLELAPSMRLHELQEILSSRYRWACEIDFHDPGEHELVWYFSEEKLEPRLAYSSQEPNIKVGLPLDIARKVRCLDAAVRNSEGDMTVARFLRDRQELRYIVRRVQGTANSPYAEIRDNLIGRNCLPIDMLRCKLSIFGATKFDPKSELWTRVNLFQGAPTFETIRDANADDWSFSSLDVSN